MFRSLRILSVLIGAAGLVLSAGSSAQVPIPLQEQVAVFNSLSPAQQQSLIRELQGQLPPAQRDAVLGMLMQQGTRPQADGAELQGAPVDIEALAAGIVDSVESESVAPRLRAGDTLVIAFLPTEPAAPMTAAEAEAASEFLDRLHDSNPYVLDSTGRLLLPGVPAIALAGLNADEATIRLGAERELRQYEITLTHLPLEPSGPAALEPFGYDLFRNAPSTFAPATDIPVPADYVIGPGDTVNIQLFGNQNAEYFLTVNRDGTINFPEIGPLGVAGLEFAEVRNLINERVNEQMIGVRVSTTLGELRSIRVFVLGEVQRPGGFTVSSLATMTNALFASGGVSEIGSLRRIALNRDGAAVTTLDLYDLLLRGDTRDDVRLQPGDVIFVPPVGATVAVDGEVRRPAIYELNGEPSVADVLALAGGLLATADPGEIRLERIVTGRGVSVMDVNFAAAASRQTPVQDGDVLRVERNLEQLEGTVRLAGNVQREGLYQWRPGMTVRTLLPGPELVKPQSDLGYVLIRREPRANVEIEALSVDLGGIWIGRPGAVDLALEPRDTVYVFHLETGRQQYIRPLLQELEAQLAPNEPAPIVRVGGRVRADGEYPLEPGMRVSDLLRAGGGLSDAAYASEAELTRYTIADGEYRQTELIRIDLAALRAGSAAADVGLMPYDFLTIREISGWREQQVVTLRGEFRFPGEYPIRPGETLRSVLNRAGGLTDFAFAEGSVFTRIDARERERARIETEARRIESSLASMALSDEGAPDALETGRSLLEQLRESQPTGRTVLRLEEIIAGRNDADVEMRDGDQLFVPKRSQEVTVIGEVQYPTSHIYEAGLTQDEYLERSGGLTRRADERRIYIVRANGEVVIDSGRRWFRRDGGIGVRPGDTIVAPLEIDRMRPLTLWSSVTQIIYNLAIAAAAINSF